MRKFILMKNKLINDINMTRMNYIILWKGQKAIDIDAVILMDGMQP